MDQKKEKNKFLPLIIGVSIVLPVAIAIIFFAPKLKVEGVNLSFLPELNAGINMLTAIMLLMGVTAIKNKILFLHKRFMSFAIILSVAFLISYVLYHLTHESTHFGGEGVLRNIYYFFLLSHIICAIVIVPLVLITYSRALAERFDKHKKMAKITFPIWLYVCISGVIVYMMISPYY